MRIETERNIKKAVYIKNYCVDKEIHPIAFVNGYITSNILLNIALISCFTIVQMHNIMEKCDYFYYNL